MDEFGEHMEEEEQDPCHTEPKYSPIPVCKCLISEPSTEVIPIPARKQQILTTVSRTEEYLRQRRIPELIRYMMTKLLVDAPSDPVSYTEKLLDDCMLFRVGLGLPPVIYERKHLEAVVKSFDPGNRGWLNVAQIRRAFSSLGLPAPKSLEEKTSTVIVLNELHDVQIKELHRLVTAGTTVKDVNEDSSSNSTGGSQN